MAGGAPALQFETNTIRPINPFLNQTCPHRVLTDVMPFLFRRFIGPEQTIEATRLPLPRRLQLLADKTLDRCRGVAHRRLALDRSNQEMEVIRHQNGGNHIPVRQASDRGLECSKSEVICQHLLPIGNAEGEKINDRLIWFQPNRNARGMSHCGDSIGRGFACQQNCRASAPLAWTTMGRRSAAPRRRLRARRPPYNRARERRSYKPSST